MKLAIGVTGLCIAVMLAVMLVGTVGIVIHNDSTELRSCETWDGEYMTCDFDNSLVSYCLHRAEAPAYKKEVLFWESGKPCRWIHGSGGGTGHQDENPIVWIANQEEPSFICTTGMDAGAIECRRAAARRHIEWAMETTQELYLPGGVDPVGVYATLDEPTLGKLIVLFALMTRNHLVVSDEAITEPTRFLKNTGHLEMTMVEGQWIGTPPGKLHVTGGGKAECSRLDSHDDTYKPVECDAAMDNPQWCNRDSGPNAVCLHDNQSISIQPVCMTPDGVPTDCGRIMDMEVIVNQCLEKMEAAMRAMDSWLPYRLEDGTMVVSALRAPSDEAMQRWATVKRECWGQP